jgi:hypothetical protein
MRRTTLLVVLAFAAGCTCARPPPPPPSLTEAITRLDAAVAADPRTAYPACKRINSEVDAFAAAPSLPSTQKEQLLSLGRELSDLCANGLTAQAPADEWKDLRGRLTQVLAGKPPGPPPRFRRDTPKEVREAIADADSAFHRRDLDAACSAIDQVTMAMSQWRWQVPPPPSLDAIRGATDQLDAMPEGCRQSELSAARERFDQAVGLLSPVR